MNHVVLSSSIITFLLCGPAVAQPTAPPPASLRIELTVATAKATRMHNVIVLEGECATVGVHGVDYVDDLEVCTAPQPNGATVRTKWHVKEGTSEYRSSWTSVVARTGARIEGGSPGTVKFTLATK